MLRITNEQKERLRLYLPEEAESLIAGEDINPIIDKLDDLVLSFLDENDEPTQKSREIEKFMDELTWKNIHTDD